MQLNCKSTSLQHAFYMFFARRERIAMSLCRRCVIDSRFIIAVLCAAAIGAAARPSWAVEVFATGHGDVGAAYEDGELELEVHLDDAGEAFAPEDVVIRVPSTTAEPRPAHAGFDALGVPAGATIYRLSQSAADAALKGSPFLGLATEEIPPHTFSAFPGTNPAHGIGLIRIELLAVNGPGHFSLWQDVGGLPGFETRPGLVGPALASFGGIDTSEDFFPRPTGIHDHANWDFTAAGEYAITLRASGELLTGEFLESVGTYNFHVAPEPGSLALAGVAVGVFAAGFLRNIRRRRRINAENDGR
jgi:surface-anchored protein